MGLALDEPNTEDKVVDFGGYRFVLAPDVAQVAAQSGGIAIDYVEDAQRRGYTVRLARGAGGSCGSAGEGCSC